MNMTWLGRIFESDHTRSTRVLVEIAENQESKHSEFVRKGLAAGFTNSQAEFMWEYVSLNDHVHEYRNQGSGWRPLTKPPLKKNV